MQCNFTKYYNLFFNVQHSDPEMGRADAFALACRMEWNGTINRKPIEIEQTLTEVFFVFAKIGKGRRPISVLHRLATLN